MKLPKLELNAPAVIGFTLISFVVLLFGYATGGVSTMALFTCRRTPDEPFLMIVRMFTHIFGHKDMEHFVSNFTVITLVGPMLEEKYGTKRLVSMIAVTAAVTGAVNLLLSNTGVLGASGIAFLFIALSSCASVKNGGIPLTMLLVAGLYIVREIMTGIVATDNISQMSHILGGVCGICYGLYYNRKVS